jgi:hypothetical protein
MVGMNWKTCGRKWSWSNTGYYSDNLLEGLRKTMKDFSQNVGTSIVLRKLELSVYGFTALEDLGRVFTFLNLNTVGRTPWTGDQLPTHNYTNTEFHDPSVRAEEYGLGLTSRGHCDGQKAEITGKKYAVLATFRCRWQAALEGHCV